jgi:TctA family transporter
MLVTLGAYQATRHIGDLLALLGFGLLGWTMKRIHAPRAPLLVGFILSTLTERYLWLTTSRYGLEWLTRPGVISIMIITAILVWLSLRKPKTKDVSQ